MTDIATLGLRVDTRDLERGSKELNRLDDSAEKAERRVRRLAPSFKSAASQAMAMAGSMAAVFGVSVGVSQTVSALSSFDTAMSKVAAVTGATADELGRMRDIAKTLGSTTEFTATQAAEGLTYLGMAGFSASESLAAIPGVLDLATAGALDLGRAADISSNILSGFAIAADDTGRVVDVMAKIAASANTSIEQLGDAMSYSAPLASAAGVSLEETAAAIGALSDAGIQGSRAGTGLSAILRRLSDPTEKATETLTALGLSAEDVDPQIDGLTAVLERLSAAGLDVTTAAALVDAEAAPALLTLAGAAPKVEELVTALEGSAGAAKEMAATMRDNLGGDIKGLGSAVEGLVLAVGEAGLTDTLRGVVQGVTEFTRSLTGLDDLGGVATKLGAVAVAAAGLVFPFAAAGVAAAAAATYLYTNWDTIRQRFPGIVGVIEAAGGAIKSVAGEVWQAAKIIGGRSSAAIGDALSAIDSAIQGDFGSALQSLRDAAGEIGGIFTDLAERWGIDTAIIAVKDSFVRFAQDAVTYAGAVVEGFVLGFLDLPVRLAGLAQEAWDAFTGAFDRAAVAGDSFGAALAESLPNAEIAGRQISEQMAKGIAISEDQVAQAARRVADAAVEAGVVAVSARGPEIGAQLVAGMVRGLQSRIGDVISAAREVADTAASTVRRFLKIQSPSKVMEQLGGYTVEGFIKGISGGAAEVTAAVQKVAGNAVSAVGGFVDELGGAIGDGLFDNFEGTGERILSAFKSMISDMISYAITNPIKVSMGLVSGGGAGGIGGLLGGSGGGSGILGGVGGFLGSFSKGIQAAATGGIFNIGSNISSAVAAGAGKLGATLGSLAPVVGIAAAAISFFSSKTTELDRGLRITIDNMDTLVETFKTVEKSRFWGLSKSIDTSYDALNDTDAAPFVSAVNAMRDSVYSMAEAVGVGAEAFEGFKYRFKVSTEGLSSEQAQEAVSTALKGAADALAERAFDGTYEIDRDLIAKLEAQREELSKGIIDAWQMGGIQAVLAIRHIRREMDELNDEIAALTQGSSPFIREGETASEALERLSSAISTVNRQFEYMGASLYEVSIAGADMASQLVDLFGGLEEFTGGVSTFIDRFYSEAEKTRLITDDLQRTLADYNAVLPVTRNEYRALVEAQDLTTERGRELYAVLIQSAEAFDTILPAAQALTAAMSGMFEGVGSQVSDQIQVSQELVREYEQAASLWFRTASTLKDFVRELQGTDLGGLTGAAQLATNRSAFNAAVTAAQGGDQEAAADIPALSRAFLSSARAASATSADYRAVAAQVESQVSLLAGIANLEGAKDTVLVGLYSQQVTVLQSLEAYLAQGDEANAKTVRQLNRALKQLGVAIEDTEAFSYERLKERLSVTVDILPRAKLPKALKALIGAEAGAIQRQVDFLLRENDLTPDLLYVAVNQASEHAKTLRFIVRNPVDPRTARLALAESSQLRKQIRFVVDDDALTPEIKLLAVSASSELTRSIRAVLSSRSDDEAQRLALTNISGLRVSVTAALGDLPDDVRRLALTGIGTYTAAIEAVVNASDMSDRAKRILLRQQGEYIANVEAVLASTSLTDKLRTVLLNANTEGVRAVTIRGVYADSLTRQERLLLSEVSTTALRTIRAIVRGVGGLSDDERAFIAPGDASASRTLRAIVRGVESLTDEQLRFLAAPGEKLDPITQVLRANIAVDKPAALRSLEAILGADGGSVRIAGGVTFDPSSAFGEALDGLATPISVLTDSLDALAGYIVADAQARKDAVARQNEIFRLQGIIANKETKRADVAAQVAGYEGEIAAIIESAAAAEATVARLAGSLPERTEKGNFVTTTAYQLAVAELEAARAALVDVDAATAPIAALIERLNTRDGNLTDQIGALNEQVAGLQTEANKAGDFGASDIGGLRSDVQAQTAINRDQVMILAELKLLMSRSEKTLARIEANGIPAR